MTINIIRLNPSQEIKLAKERDRALGIDGKIYGEKAFQKKIFQKADGSSSQNGKKECRRVFQEIKPSQPIALSPLFCVPPECFEKSDFSSIKKMECLSVQKSGGLYFFPVRITADERLTFASIPCAFDFNLAKNFDLQKIFFMAQKETAVQNLKESKSGADRIAQDMEDFSFFPTSFKFCRMEI